MGITDDLIDFAQAEVPEDTSDTMRLSLMDWGACATAGAREHAFMAFRDQHTGKGRATLVGGKRAIAAQAALVNGTLSHALDYDDTHFDHIGHPSVVIFPACLAMAEEARMPLADMLNAAAIGAEASVAVGLWLGRQHYQLGFHQTATAGAFGATLAVGRMLGLSEIQLRHALGLCATMASGLKGQFGTMGKPLNAGLAARAGIEAATWAYAGVTGPADGLEGPQGFGETHHAEGNAVTLPANPWRMDRVRYKFHACCHGLHATLEALAKVPNLHTASDIEIRTHPRWLRVCNIEAPETGLEAKFSYAHVAAMMAHGCDTADIAQFNDHLAKDSKLAAWRRRVRVTGDVSLTEMQAHVTVNGDVFTHDLDAPLSFDALRIRITQKARALVGARADDLWQAIEVDDLASFVRALT